MKTLDWKIKVCGVVSVHDARLVVSAGADAIGLNFHHRSLRCVDFPAAQAIADFAAVSKVARVGVFVNHTPAELVRIANACRLDWVQLHGDETPDVMELKASLPGTGLIRALRPEPGPVQPEFDAAMEWHRAGVDAILLDAPRQPPPGSEETEGGDRGSYGGTGRTVDWNLARELVARLPVPVILAGGLTPANVASAIVSVRPAAVDVASGVETFPGRKSGELVQKFVAGANAGW